MAYELKRVEYSARMSEETSCFTADLYEDGRKLGTVENRGTGGMTNVAIGDADYKRLKAFALAQPDAEDFEPAESYVDDLLGYWLLRRDAKALWSRRIVFLRDGVMMQTKPFPASAGTVMRLKAISNGMKPLTEDEIFDMLCAESKAAAAALRKEFA